MEQTQPRKDERAPDTEPTTPGRRRAPKVDAEAARPKAESTVVVAEPIAEAAAAEAGAAEATAAENGVPGSEAGLASDLAAIAEGLDRVLSSASSVDGDSVSRRAAAEGLSKIAAQLVGVTSTPSTAAGLLSPRSGLLGAEVDEFGWDPQYDGCLRPVIEFLYRRWFRLVCDGVDHIPSTERVLLVANHSGTFPLDGLMLRTAVRLEHPARRDVRWLGEDFVVHLPFVGVAARRLGAVRACQENAARLLRGGVVVAVFPEGVQGVGKLFRDRYRLQRFGRGGYVKLALRTSTAIVPTAIVGAEEASPLLLKVTHVSRVLGLPFLPVTPTFPWLGPLGVVPLPARWRIRFGEPVDLSRYGPEAAQDAVLVQQINDRVRTSIQTMLDDTLRTRTSVFFG